MIINHIKDFFSKANVKFYISEVNVLFLILDGGIPILDDVYPGMVIKGKRNHGYCITHCHPWDS